MTFQTSQINGRRWPKQINLGVPTGANSITFYSIKDLKLLLRRGFFSALDIYAPINRVVIVYSTELHSGRPLR
jgi:hypothetical protein